MSRCCSTLLLALLGCAVAGSARDAHAQLPADADWRTIESAHFRVTYEAGLEDLARHGAASAERAHAALSVLVTEAPSGIIDIVIADNVDFTNGYATPFPSNRIVIYARPPADMVDLQYVQDWIDLVVTHELAHIFHLDISGSVGRVVRRVFGRVPMTWPVFTAIGTPLWSVEGLAVAMESVPGFGRIHGSYHEMVVRTAAIEDEIDSIDRLSSASPVWPGRSRVYIYGSMFFDFLSRRYGEDAAAKIVRTTAGSVIPAPLWFGRVGRKAIGVTFRDAYEQWRAELDTRYRELQAELAAEGLTASEPLTAHAGHAAYPRFSPDGSLIAYAADDERTEPRTRVIDVATGTEQWSVRRHDNGAAGWLPDGRLLTTWIDFVDRFRIYGDAFVVGPDGTDRLTRAQRLQNVDVGRSGAAVAIENAGGTNRVVLLDPATGSHRAVTGFDADTHWALPRLDPQGRRIAVGRWQTGGRHDIVVMDTLGQVQHTITAGDAAGASAISASPAWSPDGEWILFWSDRTGIPNLFASRPDGTGLRQLTNVLTGAFHPDVAPDGRSIAFSAYHHDGFRVELMPFDTATWREPMPARAAVRAADPRDPAAARGTVIDSAAVAAANADTVAGDARPYRALGHLRPYYWFPLLAVGGWQEDMYGISLEGRDLVERHSWNVAAAVAPSSGRTEGNVGYTYRGLSTMPGLGLHPALRMFIARDWDTIDKPDSAGALYIEEREDVAGATIDLVRRRFRGSTGLALTGELVRRSRTLSNADSLRLIDPDDDLVGVRASTWFASGVMPPYAISRENGLTLQLSARHRVDRAPRRTTINGREIVSDGTYSELTTWNAAYRALPLPGFARHVMAARFSGLLRQGPGGGATSIGGINGTGLATGPLLADVGSTLLPVRGFAAGVRTGDRAWTASAEYRFPIALVDRSLRPLPVFVDRLAGAVFTDAGHAWCSADLAARAASCAATDATAAPVASVGVEFAAFLSLYGAALPLRLGAAWPIRGGRSDLDRPLYLMVGPSF